MRMRLKDNLSYFFLTTALILFTCSLFTHTAASGAGCNFIAGDCVASACVAPNDGAAFAALDYCDHIFVTVLKTEDRIVIPSAAVSYNPNEGSVELIADRPICFDADGHPDIYTIFCADWYGEIVFGMGCDKLLGPTGHWGGTEDC